MAGSPQKNKAGCINRAVDRTSAGTPQHLILITDEKSVRAVNKLVRDTYLKYVVDNIIRSALRILKLLVSFCRDLTVGFDRIGTWMTHYIF
jgi:hypothetical protein